METKPVREFKFTPSWTPDEFEVSWKGVAIGTVWKRRSGWVYKRTHRNRWSTKPLHNRIAAARALADEPIAEPATRYPKRGKRSRRKRLTASLLETHGPTFWRVLEEELTLSICSGSTKI